MKKIAIVAMMLALAVSCKNAAPAAEGEATSQENVVVSSDVAYVQVEAVLAQSDMSKTEGEALREKNEKAQKSLEQRQRNLENEAAKLQNDYQKGLITTRDAQDKQAAIEKKAENLRVSGQKELETLQEENTVFQNRMLDLLGRAIQEINADKKYRMIINASSLLDADTSLDITEQVLAKVNELYKAEKK